MHRASGSRSSLNLLRRKKITRSASLESDDDRRRVMELGGFGGGLRSRGGSGHAAGDVLAATGAGGMMRGRGSRDGGLGASGGGYVRSQSVSDEMDLPAFDSG